MMKHECWKDATSVVRGFTNYFDPKKHIIKNRLVDGEEIQEVNEDAFEAIFDTLLSSIRPLVVHRDPQLIVSLTSYPKRMETLYITLTSLLLQREPPDRLLLWLTHEEFPNGEADVPEKVLCLKKFGLEICHCENLRSYTKLVPALREYPDAVIVNADDDMYYSDIWLQGLYQAYKQNPNFIHCWRAHHVTLDIQGNPVPYRDWSKCISGAPDYTNFLTGIGGVLYPPHSLHPDVTKSDVFMKLAPKADDIWFWAMAVLAQHKIAIVAPAEEYLWRIFTEKDINQNGLFGENSKGGNDQQLDCVLKAYPEILQEILKEQRSMQNRFSIFYGLFIDSFVRLNNIETADVVTLENLPDDQIDLAVSLDTLDYIRNEDVWRQYIQYLFTVSKKYVLIHALNSENKEQNLIARPFLQEIDFEKWNLVNRVCNMDIRDPKDAHSYGSFYIFARTELRNTILPQIGNKGIIKLRQDDVIAFQAMRSALRADNLSFASAKDLLVAYADKNFLELLDLTGEATLQEDLEEKGLPIKYTSYTNFENTLPFDKERFDIVFCCLDHVTSPQNLLAETCRVLKQDGRVIGSASQVAPYQAQLFGNVTCYGLTKMAQNAGLREERFGLGIDAQTLMQHRFNETTLLQDPQESHVYKAIAELDKEIGEDPRITLYKQLLVAGEFSFILRREKAKQKHFDFKIHNIQGYYCRTNIELPIIDEQEFLAGYEEFLANGRPLWQHRKPELIVSMTSYPKRLETLYIPILSIFNQTVRPDRFLLWLAKEDFPNGEADLPENILRFKDLGLDIRFCENFRSHTKLVPSLREYPDAIIATIDDDMYYVSWWLERLYKAYQENPQWIYNYWAPLITFGADGQPLPSHKWPRDVQRDHASYRYVINGVCGVLYPPHCLHPDVIKKERFLTLNPTTDDIWFWGMAVLAKTKVHLLKVREPYRLVIARYMNGDSSCLWIKNAQGQQDIQIRQLLQAYPAIQQTLAGE